MFEILFGIIVFLVVIHEIHRYTYEKPLKRRIRENERDITALRIELKKEKEYSRGLLEASEIINAKFKRLEVKYNGCIDQLYEIHTTLNGIFEEEYDEE